MKFPTGALISVPLTMIQTSNVHLHTGTFMLKNIPVVLPLLSMNVLLSHGVYDYDRLDLIEDEHTKSVVEITTYLSVCVAGSTMWTYEELRIWVPWLLMLHRYYADMKPTFCAIKPLFIATCWLVATYYIPLYMLDYTSVDDVATPLSVVAQMSAFSNMADIPDIEEDRENNIFTPAVVFGEKKSAYLSILLMVFSILLHTHAPHYDRYDIVYDVLNTIGFSQSLLSMKSLKEI